MIILPDHKSILQENMNFSHSNTVIEEGKNDKGEKDLYMKGIFIQGGVKNHNQRIYPVPQIESAVSTLKEQIDAGNAVLGEVDHPDDLKINLDRVCHMITEMWMDGPNGYGKLKIINTPMGIMVKTLLESGVKLGVSSRGSGEVNDNTGEVSGFEIVTVDVVAQPSAPNAYPTAIYEGFMNANYGHRLIDMASDAAKGDKLAQSRIKNSIIYAIKDLKLNKE